ncbi:MAG: metallophosphoesterase [Clostridiales bacterium]|nr:metallophosphoesterase [Clostridiales bacterium]
MKSFLKKKYMPVVVILIAFILLIGVGLWSSKYMLALSKYDIYTEKVESPIRIVLISDLHDSRFGNNNRRLIELIEARSPDAIMIAGDLVDSGKEETDTATDLISELCGICPVYVSYGNHEYEHEEIYGTDMASLYEDAGATVMEKEYADVSVGGQMIRIGGVYGYCIPTKYLGEREDFARESAFVEEFQDTDLYTVLMCHMPVCWILSNGLDEWDVDCVLAGHVHGGQIIIPFVGGLYAPDFGWFPGKLEGLYYSDDGRKTLVLTRGLGSTETVPRFNNIPEVVVVDIMPE